MLNHGPSFSPLVQTVGRIFYVGGHCLPGTHPLRSRLDRVWLSEARLHEEQNLTAQSVSDPPAGPLGVCPAMSKHVLKTPTHTVSSCRKNLSEISLRFYPSVISSSGKHCNKPCPCNKRKHNRAAHKTHTTEAPRERLQPNSTPVPVNAPTPVNDTKGPRWRRP